MNTKTCCLIASISAITSALWWSYVGHSADSAGEQAQAGSVTNHRALMSADGQSVLLACGGFVQRNDMDERRLLEQRGPFGTTEATARSIFSADGKYLLNVGTDNIIKAWDLATEKLVKEFKGHTDKVAQASPGRPTAKPFYRPATTKRSNSGTPQRPKSSAALGPWNFLAI